MGCKIILFLQPIQLFKLLYFNILKKDIIFLLCLLFRKSGYKRLAK